MHWLLKADSGTDTAASGWLARVRVTISKPDGSLTIKLVGSTTMLISSSSLTRTFTSWGLRPT